MRRLMFGLWVWAVFQPCSAQNMDWLALCPIPSTKDFNNGCGSGWNGPLVPDKINFLGVDFRKNCSDHDQCYSNCLPGGKNFCKPICQEMAKDQREDRRTVCDKEFFSSMNDSCTTAACRATAFTYYWTVKIVAGGNFAGEEIPPSVRQALAAGTLEKAGLQSLLDDVEKSKKAFGVQSGYKLKVDLANGQLSVIAQDKRNPHVNVQQIASKPLAPRDLAPFNFESSFVLDIDAIFVPAIPPPKLKLVTPKSPSIAPSRP